MLLLVDFIAGELPFSGFVTIFVWLLSSPESERYAKKSTNENEGIQRPALQGLERLIGIRSKRLHFWLDAWNKVKKTVRQLCNPLLIKCDIIDTGTNGHRYNSSSEGRWWCCHEWFPHAVQADILGVSWRVRQIWKQQLLGQLFLVLRLVIGKTGGVESIKCGRETFQPTMSELAAWRLPQLTVFAKESKR